MQFDSLAEFVAMGGHAQYVWMAYGTAVLVFVGYTISLLKTRTRIVKELKWRAKAEEMAGQDKPAG